MKIAAISDTHTYHESLKIPECDILIHAGDFSYRGTEQEIKSFTNWLSRQDQCKHKVFICGNHDGGLAQKNPNLFKSLIPNNVTYLQDSSITIEGIKIYGTPWTPYFYDWSFNGLEERGVEGLGYQGGPGWGAEPDSLHRDLKEVFNQIEEDTNILVCHGPPRIGNIDRDLDHVALGSNILFDNLIRLTQLKAGIYGHIHEGRGIHFFNGVTHYNVSTCDRDYQPYNPIVTFEI